MTTHRRASAACALAALLVFSTAAAAQHGPTRHEWSHGTMLGVFADDVSLRGPSHHTRANAAVTGGPII